MTPRTVPVSRDELVARRTKILDGLGTSLEEFSRRARAGSLSGDEWYAAEDLEEIGFLLADGTDDDF
ncbi:hypothetical protein [Georgenia alba]|uniref:Uncharacterized protein n=1 Tax=Georgenia alba TaxID=2233858 RepID=A0ABW2Q570_9MICO